MKSLCSLLFIMSVIVAGCHVSEAGEFWIMTLKNGKYHHYKGGVENIYVYDEETGKNVPVSAKIMNVGKGNFLGFEFDDGDVVYRDGYYTLCIKADGLGKKCSKMIENTPQSVIYVQK